MGLRDVRLCQMGQTYQVSMRVAQIPKVERRCNSMRPEDGGVDQQPEKNG